ncbi:hypothetical protein BDP27DRAFT_1419555 [Rhodocollybia butyracea]|uniref:Uncharacterized protein n=1 Tax=Rhodocollybia butyracea TaxID=206335 RepID=A0A9P5UA80_9AGAR|nr:hypothetical protein BDP27DRAFT_1419555 [Rhodocollybia butyracea]
MDSHPASESSPGSLPHYSASSPPPFYSERANEGEEVLAATRVYQTPTGSFTSRCHCGNVTVTLKEQNEDIETPSYHQQGLIFGTIVHQNTDNFLQVEAKLKMTVFGHNSTSSTMKVVDESCELWSKTRENPLCPKTLDFMTALPSTFQDGDREFPLPPSHKISLIGLPGLYSQCSYTLKVVVVVRGPLWNKNKSFFIPSERKYGIKDEIPFHIQLTGPASSLKALYSHLLLEHIDNGSSVVSLSPPPSPSLTGQPPACTSKSQTFISLRVTLNRQVCVEIKDQVVWKHFGIGEGRVHPLPPPFESVVADEEPQISSSKSSSESMGSLTYRLGALTFSSVSDQTFMLAVEIYPTHQPLLYNSEIPQLFPPPNYSSKPVCGEQSIQFTPRTRNRPTGTYTQKSGNTTVLLMNQEEGLSMPVYGRQGTVNGIIGLSSREAVAEVQVELHGYMEVHLYRATPHNTTLVNHTYTVWKQDSDSADQVAVCPSELPFSCVFPSTFEDRIGRQTILAPSIQATYPGSTGLIHYASVKKYRAKFSAKEQSTPSPIPSNADFLLDVKMSPEAWYQTTLTIKSRKPTVTPPVHCSLFIPSVRMFGFSDTIHFHVQMTGPILSLRQLVCAKSSKSSSPGPSAVLSANIRVYLMRQIYGEVYGQKGLKNLTLAEGTFSPRPPPFTASSIGPIHGNSTEESLDWEGEIRCDEDLIPGFVTEELTVKDFLVLSVSPQDLAKSDLIANQVLVVINLVTESAETWMED